MTTEINERFAPLDLIARWRYVGLTAKLNLWAASNYSLDFILSSLMEEHIMPRNAIKEQLLQYIADARLAGDVLDVEYWGETELPEAIQRAAAPASLGNNANNVWFGSEEYAAGKTFWYYVDKEFRYAQTGLNMIDRTSLGVCPTGARIQICEVAAGVVGWWAAMDAT
jgi:hypothetical protein